MTTTITRPPVTTAAHAPSIWHHNDQHIVICTCGFRVQTAYPFLAKAAMDEHNQKVTAERIVLARSPKRGRR